MIYTLNQIVNIDSSGGNRYADNVRVLQRGNGRAISES